jgi:twinkle protein
LSRIVQKNQPCESCGSSDAKQIYEDNSAYCFSCRKYYKSDNSESETVVESTDNKKQYNKAALIKEIYENYPSRGFKERNIYKAVAELYGVKVSYDESGEIDTHYYPYRVNENGQPGGYKIMVVPKDYSSRGSIGTVKGLFGMHLWKADKRLIITEGEKDCMAIQCAYYKKYKRFFPVVSLRASTATKDLVEIRDKLRANFKEIIYWPDNDEAGEKAKRDVAKIIGYDKVKIVNVSDKDANDLWIRDQDAVLNAVYNAKSYTPAGILDVNQLWEQLEQYNTIESHPYPKMMDRLNDKLKGMRLGEITLWTSGTGSGKSTLLREIALHLLETTDEKVGIVSLEESPAETARKLSGMHLMKNPAKDEIPLDELKEGFDSVFGDGRVMVLDHHGSVNDESIIDFLEFMCLSDVKYIFVDHITILASEGMHGLTGNEAIDKIMNELLRIAKKYNVWIGLISHLRKVESGKSFEDGKLPTIDDIRGSGSIKQISFDIIAFARNLSAADETERNTIKTKVLKCRYTGLTGPTGTLIYNYNTGRLEYGNDFEEFTPAPSYNENKRF